MQGDVTAGPPEKRVVILGAGPAGLTAAYELSIRHRIPVCVVEKDPEYVGGISRTVEREGFRFDIGGHRFFSKSKEVEDFWTEVLGEQMLVRPRLSRILYKGKYFDYPLKAKNALLNLGLVETVKCLWSYAVARVFPVRNPQSLEDWVSNQFGKRLFQIFFKTYTEKVWGISTKELSADWAAQRIKGLNLSEAIKNALLPRPKGKKGGTVITTLIDEFRYPRLGPGQMWEQVQRILTQHEQIVAMGQDVIAILSQLCLFKN
jgi:protoporphyrinogen oxidase